MASGGIGRASMLLASGTLVSRVLGFVKAIVLAQTLGVVASVSADSFAIANSLPSSIYSIIAGGVLNAVLVPQVVRAARHPDGGQTYINRLVTLAIVLLAGITLIMTLGAPVVARIYGASLSGEQLSLVIAFAYWCMPQIFFYGLYAVLGEVLNARGLFGPFTWAPVLNNVIGIGFLWVFSAMYGADPTGTRLVEDWTPDMIALLGSTTTAGVACQALVLFVFWRRVGLTFRLDFRWRGTGLSKAGRLAGWTFGMLLIMQFSGLVETIVLGIASGASASVAAFQNAYLIFVLPHSIITVSIATAYFTRMSEAASEHRIRDLVRDFSGGARLIGLFIVFAAWAIAVISPAFSRVFESSASGVTAMAIVLVCFLVGLVTFCGLFLVQRAFYALEDTRTQFWLFLATMPLHVFGMAVVATFDPQFIAAGLALMQSLMSMIRLVVLLWLLRRRIGHLDTRNIVRAYIQFGAAALGAAVVGFLVMWPLGAYAEGGFARSGIAAALLSCVIGGIVMVVVYLALLFVMRSPELREAIDPVLTRLGRGGARADAQTDDADSAEQHAPIPQSGRGEAAQPVPAAPRDTGWFDDLDTSSGDHADHDGRVTVAAGDAHDATRGAGRADASGHDDAHVTPSSARDGGATPHDDAWSAWLGDDRGARPANPEVERREIGAYGGTFASLAATGDLSTAGILLPMHATGAHGPRTRRERRELEQRAAQALAKRHADRQAGDGDGNAPRPPGAPAAPTTSTPPPAATPPPSRPTPSEASGPRGAAERRRRQLRDAEQERWADEPVRGPQPAPRPAPEQDPPRNAPRRPSTPPRGEDDAQSLFKEWFGDDE